jgi:beta-N-acetylhexosaminidase
VNSLSEQQWKQTFGRVYEACFNAGVHAVMAGHIALPWLEYETATGGAPLPATTSRRILDDLLRKRLGYDGVLVSDALIMAGFRGKTASREDMIIEAFNAGIDVMLWPGPDYFEIMERAIGRGRISMDRLNCSVGRILKMKARQKNLLPDAPQVGAPEISKVAQERGAVAFATTVAEGSLTLVENKRDVLPLDPDKVRRIQVLVATPKEKGVEDRLEPLLKGLRERGIVVNVHVNGNCLDLQHKEMAGERYDALIAIFELWTHGLKNTMRPTGAMAECMWTIQRVETMHPIIISLGSPYLLQDMPWAETYINAYSSNLYTVRAIERALFGEIPFQGISPVDTLVSWTKPEGVRHANVSYNTKLAVDRSVETSRP